jgi:ankyrin repeat protein
MNKGGDFMATLHPDLMNELKDLIRGEKISEAIAFLEQNKEQLQNATVNNTVLLHLLISQKWNYYEQALSSRCEIESDAKYGNQIRWLPFTPLDDTIELPPFHRLCKLLLKYSADVNMQDKDGNTPLHWAVRKGNESLLLLMLENGAGTSVIVRLLLENGASTSVNVQNTDGQTPLHLAVLIRNESVVRLLLANGADVNVPNKNGSTPMHNAASTTNESVVRLLLQSGADLNVPDKYYGETPLHKAVEFSNESVVRLLLQSGANVKAQDKNGKTPLHRAALIGDKSVVRLLLENGARVDVQNESGDTPLSFAVITGYKSVTRLLLESGADVNVQNKNGETPLHRALKLGSKSVVCLLLEHGADVTVQNKDGETPLHWVANKNNKALWGRLSSEYSEQLDIKPPGTDGTHLHSAVSEGNESMARLLLENGASTSIKMQNTDGKTPLHLAASSGNESVVRLLLEYDASTSVDVQDKDGRTLLHWAASSGNKSMVRLLLKYGARVDVQDKDGRTPMYGALKSGEKSIVVLLLKYGADVSNKNTAPYWANESLVTLLSWASNAKKIDRSQQISNNEEKNLQTSSAGQTTSWLTRIYEYGNSLYGWWNAAKTPSEEIFVEEEVVVEAFDEIQRKLIQLLIHLEFSDNPNSNLRKECLHYQGEIERYHKEDFSVSAAELEKLNCTMDNLQERIDPNFRFESRQLSANTTGFFNSTLSGNTFQAITQIDIPRLG